MPVLEQQSDLLQQFAHGDLAAFEMLFRQYQSEVYRWTVHIVRDPGAAEDLTIETFWRIYKAHARFDPTRSFAAWARKIATNAALDYLKTARPEVALLQDFPARGAADPVIQRDIREHTQRAFRQLPAKLQVAATLALIRAASQRSCRGTGHFRRSGQTARVSRAPPIKKKLETTRCRTMNNKEDEKIQTLLKQAMAPVDRELERDLWPQMLRRLEQRAAAVPWFDWALLALLVVGLLISPHTIPVLLYHL